ncbi:MAG: 6-pyruvoyl-tetrahydropterin synthase-related protein [Candidatus Acidiferrum sp.]
MTSSTEPQNPVRSTARLHGWLPAIFVSAFISLIIVSPFFRLGSATGHDFLFHISSWMDAAGQWKEGIFYPRWTEWANYGFGEPRFIFYPPFSWMLGAVLGFLVPWTAVPGVFIALVQTFSGLSAFALARRILPERAALFCAACFVANPYALVIIYLRSDFAELLANAFFPLLFLAAFQICELMESPQQVPGSSKSRAIVFFAVVLAAIWLSNAPAGVIACYSSVAVFGFAALSRKAWQPLLRGAAGLALGLGLAGFYILPAAYEQRWVNIGEALASGLLPSENFLFTVINDPEHTLFNWIVSSIAIFLMVFAGVAALAAHRARRESEGAVENRLWQALLLLAGLASALMFRFTSIFWSALPKLRFVQFPWRWMAILAVAFAIFVGAAMGRKRWGWMWAVVTFAVIGAGGTGLVHQAWWYRGDIPILRQAIASGEGFEGTFEYDPTGDDHTNVPVQKAPEVQVMDTDSTPGPNTAPVVRVDRWAPEEKEVTVKTKDPFALGLRLLNYPAWRVTVNGAVVTPLNGEDYNQMLVELQPGESHIQARFVRTWDRTVGDCGSLASAFIGLWLLRRRSSG